MEKISIINELVLGFIVRGQRPISIVEDDAFIDLLAYLEPGYSCPGRTYFTDAIDAKYKEATARLALLLSEVTDLCITTDTWTSVATESYLTITVHYVSKDWFMQNHVLGTMLLEERHTGEKLSKWMLKMVGKFQIDPSKIVAVVHDNASNIVCAMNLLKQSHGWESVRCSAHTLQLAVHSALGADARIQSVLASARKLVEHFRRSTTANSALTKQQEQMQLKPLDLVQDVATRWCSTFSMCKRLKELRLPVSMVMANREVVNLQKRQQLELTTESWFVLESLCDVLEPFAVLTKYLEGQSYVSISALQPLIKGVLLAMDVNVDDAEFIANFKREASVQLESRFAELFSIQAPTCDHPAGRVAIAVKACAVDPRFHKLKSLSSGHPIIVRRSLENELVAVGQLAQPQPDANSTSNTELGASE